MLQEVQLPGGHRKCRGSIDKGGGRAGLERRDLTSAQRSRIAAGEQSDVEKEMGLTVERVVGKI